MATRQDFQIASDICRFANIINDLLDYCAYSLRLINPDNGGALRILVPSSEMGAPPIYREPTVDDLKGIVVRHVTQIQTYYAGLNSFINGLGLARVRDALLAWEIDVSALRNDLLSMYNIANTLEAQVNTAATFADCETGATYIDNNVPKLPLFRRRWSL